MKLQKSVKIKFLFIAALALSFLMALGTFFGVTFARAKRDVTISGSTNTFRTVNGAEVWAHQEGEGENAEDHTMFVFNDNKDSVNFRKNLAFKWVENKATQTEASTEENASKPDINFEKNDGWFNLEIGFGYSKVEYKYFVITFESQQYSQTKDGKSTNYIVFAPAADNKLGVYITHKETEDEDLNAVLEGLDKDNPLGTVDAAKLKIEFTDYVNGNYAVAINKETDNVTGTFENVGKTYAKYSSSTTTPVTPLSFEAVFEEEDENEPDANKHGRAFMTLYTLNNQSFKLEGARTVEQHRAGGTVNDTTPPVLCLDKSVPFIKYNSEITFDYTVIDVLTSSPSLTTSYYMLTTEDKNKAPVYNEDGGDYKKVTDSDNQYIFPHYKHYQPTAADLQNTVFNDSKNFEVKAAVKVVLKLTDTTSTGGQTTYVLLDWFVADNNLIKMKDSEGNDVPYIAVTTDKQGVAYAYTKGGTSDPEDAHWVALNKAYQALVDQAAKDLKAGNKNYFYLPQLDNIEYKLDGDDTEYVGSLLADNATPYEDLTFSIYYNNGSQQQATGKNSNNLSINLTKAGKYKFTVYAKDAAGNSMYYYKEGEDKATDLETGDIWKMYEQKKDTEYAGMKNYLPWFEFTVGESEISIKDPDEQSTAYVGSSFTPDSFEIDGSAKTVYSLYEFQNDRWAKEKNGGKAMRYEDFSKDVETLLKDYREYFTRIRPASELKEGTNDYDNFHDYGWNGSSLSFTPQTANAFYVIKCEASNSGSSVNTQTVTKCMTVVAAPKVADLKGEDTWVQDNVTSIVLLCIAGASLIGIILLLVIKPKNKGDIDEVIETTKKHKKH